jgi:signal transduction histidine kinase
MEEKAEGHEYQRQSYNQGLISGNKHTAVLEISDTASPVAAIPILVKEVIANYLTNAIKYTPQGGRITLRCIDLGGRVRVEVEDTGIGIDQEDQKKLFQEFSRIRREPREGEIKIPGIGLGLSIAKRIIEMHGGMVSLESEPGRGSVFSFEIPACEPGDDPVLLPEMSE